MLDFILYFAEVIHLKGLQFLQTVNISSSISTPHATENVIKPEKPVGTSNPVFVFGTGASDTFVP